MNNVLNKQKFFKPAVSKNETRKLYDKASEKFNNQFFDETGKFIRLGSKKLTFDHKEIFMGIVALMDAKLKVYNFSNKYPEARDFVKHPFMFSITIQDVKCMTMQNEEFKRKSDEVSIKRYLYRLRDAGILKTFQWRRGKMKYDVLIDPELTVLREIATDLVSPLGSDINDSKKTDCSFYTIYNTSIKNNKTNPSDFNIRENLQANFVSDQINLKKNREDGNPAPEFEGEKQIDLIISGQKFDKIIDNRSVKEKKNQKEQIAGEIFKASASADEQMNEEIRNRINKMLWPIRKTPSFSPEELKKDHDFYHFKKNTVVAFYIFLLNVIFPDKAKSYGPRDFDSPYRIYVLQSLQELVTNPKYFGKCRTIQHFEHQRQFLQNVVMNMKNRWLRAHPDFNFQYVAPNVFLSGGYKNLKFEKSVDYFTKKQHEKNETHVKAQRTISEKQFGSAIKIVEKLINIKANFGLHMTKEFQAHCRVYLDKEGLMRIRSEHNSDNYRFLQYFIKIYNVDYKKNKIN